MSVGLAAVILTCPVLKAFQDAPIVVYCSVGIRSQRVGQQLLEAGYTQVWNLRGGIFKFGNGHKSLIQKAT